MISSTIGVRKTETPSFSASSSARSNQPHRFACSRNLQLNHLRFTTLCMVLRLSAKPCKVNQWAVLDSNTLNNPEEFAVFETGDAKCVTLPSGSVAKLAMLLGNWGDAPRHDIPPSDCPLKLINP